jgi:hypothetical protein
MMPIFLGLAGRRGVLRSIVATLVAASGVLAAAPASAFCRTTTVALPPAYNPAKSGCYTDGLDLWWSNACVGFMINQNASPEIPYADAKRIIDGAFGTWMAITCPKSGKPLGITVSDLGAAVCDKVTFNQHSPNQNLIMFDTTWPYNDPNNTLGLTTVTFDSTTGEILDADMELNSSAHNLSITDQVPANGFDLASVVTHEAGHFLGLAHATSPSSTMFASYKPGSTALRTLSADDIAGVCTIYPDSTVRSSTPTTLPSGAVQGSTVAAGACDPTPKNGLTTECVTAPLPTNESKCSVIAVEAGGGQGGGALRGLVAAALLARLVRRRRQASALS